MEKIRLSRLMAQRGLCSRREADSLIERGQVSVDGRIIDVLGTRVEPDVEISVSPAGQESLDARVTIMLNKPVGYVSGQPEGQYPPAVRLVTTANQYRPPRDPARFEPAHLRGLAPAGRLDIESQGLLVLTQDGRVARALVGPEGRVEKEYLVRVRQPYTEEHLARLRHGLELDGRPLRRARVQRLNESQIRFVLTEGRKRQIRRMCELVDLEVSGLKRVRIGKLRLGGLPEGQWRYVDPATLVPGRAGGTRPRSNRKRK